MQIEPLVFVIFWSFLVVGHESRINILAAAATCGDLVAEVAPGAAPGAVRKAIKLRDREG